MIRWKKQIILAVAFVLSVLTLSACRHTPDETRVREAIAAVAHAAEAGAAGDVVAPLVDDFDGNGGELDRERLRNMVRLLALRGDHVGVILGPISIEHRGERMVASFTVTLSSGGKLLPDQLGVYKVESAWKEEGGDWRCYSASWSHSIQASVESSKKTPRNPGRFSFQEISLKLRPPSCSPTGATRIAGCRHGDRSHAPSA